MKNIYCYQKNYNKGGSDMKKKIIKGITIGIGCLMLMITISTSTLNQSSVSTHKITIQTNEHMPDD